MLKVEIQKLVANVILDRPDLHNAFDDKLVVLLKDTFTHLSASDQVRVIILRGNGKSFCAGADLKWMKRVAKYSREENLKDARALALMFLTIARCPKPVIARVHGAALGGGSGLVAACDIAVAVEAAQFGFTEVKLGIIPAVISPFVIARIGAQAREYFLTGERFPASVAQQAGLVRHVVPDEVTMDALIEAKVAQIVTSSPSAIVAAKKLFFAISEKNLDASLEMAVDAIAQSRASDEGQAGIAAFLKREKPPWIPR